MRVSENWLREWANPAKDINELAEILTMAGLEVDSIDPVAASFDKVIVAQVLETKPHPDANKLNICIVDTGTENLQIVCGASNVRAGLKVALAQIGANLPNGLKIKEAKLRGVLSQGMLCSATELGMAEASEGIMELEQNAPLGEDFRAYFALNDCILDIELTPNRADCLSILGIAREASALTQTPLQFKPIQSVEVSISETKNIEVKEPEACPRYCARIIQSIDPLAQTPLWMKERLRRSGIRVIHPVVDILNYVMIELGQPMHAFDASKLQGDISVRYAKERESLELLDGQTIELKPNELIISDEKQALALAGIMGGIYSSVQENTSAILLESAFFNPATIAGVGRRHGLCTDASQRFERGVDSQLQIQALERASMLIAEITRGIAGPITEVVNKDQLPNHPPINFSHEKVRQLIGIEISSEKMQNYLVGLGMSLSKNSTNWLVTAPSHRFDIHLEVDLIEEIVRLYGYDRIPGNKMHTVLEPGSLNPLESLSMKASQFFAAKNYQEAISYSFVDPKLQAELHPNTDTLNLVNPISSELSQMRISLWPGLLASMVHNAYRQQTVIKLFECGVVFEKCNGELEEHAVIAGLSVGEKGTMNWAEQRGKFDFYDVKGDLQSLFSSLKLEDVAFIADSHPALHPGKSAKILIAGKEAGWCGVIHPRINDALDIQDEIILFELKLQSCLNPKRASYKPLSKFPQIRRDLSLLVDEDISVAQIEELVRNTIKNKWLRSFDVFDLYQSASLPKGKKSLAIALTLQENTRTLTDNEINDVIDAILKELNNKLSIILRE
jgi:phenylalanyl-tRNA synthetase beta chain